MSSFRPRFGICCFGAKVHVLECLLQQILDFASALVSQLFSLSLSSFHCLLSICDSLNSLLELCGSCCYSSLGVRPDFLVEEASALVLSELIELEVTEVDFLGAGCIQSVLLRLLGGQFRSQIRVRIVDQVLAFCVALFPRGHVIEGLLLNSDVVGDFVVCGFGEVLTRTFVFASLFAASTRAISGALGEAVVIQPSSATSRWASGKACARAANARRHRAMEECFIVGNESAK